MSCLGPPSSPLNPSPDYRQVRDDLRGWPLCQACGPIRRRHVRWSTGSPTTCWGWGCCLEPMFLVELGNVEEFKSRKLKSSVQCLINCTGGIARLVCPSLRYTHLVYVFGHYYVERMHLFGWFYNVNYPCPRLGFRQCFWVGIGQKQQKALKEIGLNHTCSIRFLR